MDALTSPHGKRPARADTSCHELTADGYGFVVMLPDGREALVTARVETGGVGPFAGLLEVAVAPPTPLTSDDAIA